MLEALRHLGLELRREPIGAAHEAGSSEVSHEALDRLLRVESRTALAAINRRAIRDSEPKRWGRNDLQDVVPIGHLGITLDESSPVRAHDDSKPPADHDDEGAALRSNLSSPCRFYAEQRKRRDDGEQHAANDRTTRPRARFAATARDLPHGLPPRTTRKIERRRFRSSRARPAAERPAMSPCGKRIASSSPESPRSSDGVGLNFANQLTVSP